MTAGFVVGLAIPMLPFLILLGGIWPYVLIVGAMFALIPLLMTIWLFAALRLDGQLRIWWAVVAGAVATALPFEYLIVATSLDPNSATGAENEMWRYGGPLSLAGLRYFVLPVLPLVGLGAVAGLGGWLTAFGWRVSAPQRDPIAADGESRPTR